MKGSANGRYLVTADCQPGIWGEDSGYLYVSSNYGSTWTPTGSAYDFKAVASSSTGQKMAAVSSAYLLISKNYGTSWTVFDKASNYSANSFAGVTISGDGLLMYATTLSGKVLKYSWNQSSNTWSSPTVMTLPNNANGAAITTSNTGNIAYVATFGYGIMKLNNLTWSVISGTVTSSSVAVYWNQIQSSSDGTKLIASGYRNSLSNISILSTNSGSSVSYISSSPADGISPNAVSISPDGSVITLAGRDSNDYENLLISYDNASTWVTAKGMSWGIFDSVFIANDNKTFYVGRIGWSLWKYSSTPDAVTNISATTIKNTSLVLKWRPPAQNSDANSTITSYSVLGSSDDGATWTAYSGTISAAGLVGGDGLASTTITGLTSRTSYKFKVTANSGYGVGVPAISSTFKTIDLPSAPINLTRVGFTNSRDITFTWSAPTDTGTASITSYIAEYSADTGTTWNPLNVYTQISAYPNGVSQVGNLSTRVNYQFRVRAVNPAGEGPNSAILSGFAYSNIGPVLNLSSSLTPTSATLTWDPPASDGGSDLNVYYVEYKLASSSTWTIWSNSSLTRTATITGLTSGQLYDFRVRVTNIAGWISTGQYIYNDRPPLPAAQISITRSASGFRSGLTFTVQPRLSLLASNSSLVTGDSRTVVTVSVSFGATLLGNTSETATGGIVTFQNLGIRGTAGTTYTLTYFSGSLISATESITVMPGLPAKLIFNRSTGGVQVGASFSTQPRIHVLDADNNVVTSDDTTTVTMSSSTGFLWDGSSSNPSARASAGVITFSGVRWTGSVSTSAILNYVASGLNSLTETLTATEGAAATLTRITRAQDAPLGNPFVTQPVYQIIDAGGNPVSTFNGPITISASQGTLSGTKVIDAKNGVAEFKDLSLTGINASQLVILTVTSPGFTPYTGDSIVTLPGRPILSWSSLFLSTGTSSFTIHSPTSNVAGTFTYSSNSSAVATFSGSTLNVNGAGTATLTSTFTPTDTSNYRSGETVTMTLTVIGGENGILISISGGSNSVAYRSTVTITANVDNDGVVTFYAQGKRIPGCVSKLSSAGVRTCLWKPSTRGAIQLSASLNPTSDSYPAVRSNVLNVAVVSRTGRR